MAELEEAEWASEPSFIMTWASEQLPVCPGDTVTFYRGGDGIPIIVDVRQAPKEATNGTT